MCWLQDLVFSCWQLAAATHHTLLGGGENLPDLTSPDGPPPPVGGGVGLFRGNFSLGFSLGDSASAKAVTRSPRDSVMTWPSSRARCCRDPVLAAPGRDLSILGRPCFDPGMVHPALKAVARAYRHVLETNRGEHAANRAAAWVYIRKGPCRHELRSCHPAIHGSGRALATSQVRPQRAARFEVLRDPIIDIARCLS